MKMKKSRSMALLLALILLLAGCADSGSPSAAPEGSPAGAQSQDPQQEGEVPKPEGYPSKNISWIVPTAAGSAVDLPVRALVDALTLGTNIVVENIEGASQTIGALEASIRPADGYTLLAGANAWAIIQPNMNPLNYAPEDFRHIVMTAPAMPSYLITRADSQLKNFEDLKAKAENGDRIVCGVANIGSYDHLAVVSMFRQLGCDDVDVVAYNGSAQLLTAVLSGEVDVGPFNEGDISPRIKEGDVQALAVLSDQRSEFFPDIPAVEEHGIKDMATFKGLKWVAVRKDTPNEVVEWLKQELNKAIQSKAYQDYLVQAGFGPVRTYTEEEVTEIVLSANKIYRDILEELGMAKAG